MKIDKYKRMNNGIYRVYLENGLIIDLYEDVILKENLLINSAIDENDIKRIKLINDSYDCYYKAIEFLKVSLKTEKEVREKLKKLGFRVEDIDITVERLKKQGYIDDLKYANAFLNTKLLTTSYGPFKIRMELEKKGVVSNIIDDVLKKYDENEQKNKITKIVEKQVKANRNKGNNYLKKKIKIDLCNQGFFPSVVNQVLDNTNFGDDSIIREKEYQKIKARLSRKYSGMELEYKIRERLMQKGL